MSSRKFILSSTELGRVTLQDDPKGWDEVKRVYDRNMKYLGVFRKRTANLRFIGDGLAYCVELFNLSGTESVLNVVVMQKKDYEDAWIEEFVGIGKFNPFDIEFDDLLNPSLVIEFEDSGFHNKFLTRAGMDINIGSTTSVEGVDMGEVPTEKIQVHQRSIEENNIFKLSVNAYYYHWASTIPEPYIVSEKGHVLPMEKQSGDTEFVQTPDDYLLISPGLVTEPVPQPTAFKIKYSIAGSGEVRRFPLAFIPTPDQVGWYLRKFFVDGYPAGYTDTLLFEITGIAEADSTPIAWNFSGELDITLNTGESFTIVCELEHGVEVTTPYLMEYTKCDIEVKLIQNFNEYVSNCHYRYEFMQRLAQLMTDQVDSFKSTAFGRTDIGYVSNGPWWNNVCFNGRQLRGFDDQYPVRSFEKSFQSARAIWNVGCGIERFGTRYKIVIEDLSYFFRGDISITLHNVRKVKRKINEQFTFSEVRVGYEKAEYEEVNGLEEYNNKSVFATFIKSDTNILDLISPDRADGYGMEFARRKSKQVAQSEDTSYDNEVFTAMVNKDGDGLLRTQKDENYSSVLNIQSPETATNLDITPQRNLLRNGDWIKGCCYKYPNELLKFISSDKPSDLETTRNDESSAVTEQVSISNSELRSSLWLNLSYLFEADITQEDSIKLELKPNSLVKFSPFNRQQTSKYYYGWIINVQAGGKERSGSFTLLAANINSDRLKLIDPEGVENVPPSTPLPPMDDVDGGFEYAFEHAFES